MKFKPATEPNPLYDDHGYKGRLESETGRWTIFTGLTIMGGTRVYAALTGEQFFSLDNCGGPIASQAIEVYFTTVYFLEQFDESVDQDTVRQAWPWFEFKPLPNNPEWAEFRDRMLMSAVSPFDSIARSLGIAEFPKNDSVSDVMRFLNGSVS